MGIDLMWSMRGQGLQRRSLPFTMDNIPDWVSAGMLG